jgi:predicted transcriptional regulator
VASQRPVLLSLRPRFAGALLDGTKTVEIRRRPVRFHVGALCLLYASSPARALTGALLVAGVDCGTPGELWRRHGPRTSLTRKEYDDYLHGRSTACALVVTSPIAFRVPVPLAELRRRLKAFLPPQSYRFVHEGELDVLLNGEAAELIPLTAQLHLPAILSQSASRESADGAGHLT